MRANYFVLGLLLTSGLAGAADTPKVSPESVMKELNAALEREGPAGLARFLHPEEQQRFKEMMIGGESGGLRESMVKSIFGPEATLESARAMPADQFTERAMAKMNEMYALKFSTRLLGSVREGNLVHFVSRSRAEGEGMIVDTVDVVTLRPWGDTWRANLRSNTVQAPSIPRARLSAEPPPPPPSLAPPPPPKTP